MKGVSADRFARFRIPLPQFKEAQMDSLITKIQEMAVDNFSSFPDWHYFSFAICSKEATDTSSMNPCFKDTPLEGWLQNFADIIHLDVSRFVENWIAEEFSKFADLLIAEWEKHHYAFSMICDGTDPYRIRIVKQQ